MMVGCLVMIIIGLLAFFNLDFAFKNYPCESQRQNYNLGFFAPYTLLFSLYFIEFFSSVFIGSRLFFVSMCFGGSVFCLFFTNVGGVGHDFGHVIFGGCFESMAMDRGIITFNIVSVIASIVLIYNVIKYKSTNKLSAQQLDASETMT